MLPNRELVEQITASRGRLPRGTFERGKAAEEGGCGVTGFISSIPVSGRHIYEPSVQMHNRGNGKGGGIAAIGLSARDLGVTQEVLDSHYMLQVALLDPGLAPEVEKEFVAPYLEVHKSGRVPTVSDYREIEGLEVRPPDVWRYFVRVKKDVLDRFVEENQLQRMAPRQAEDEFIYQNSYRLNQKYYAALGEKQAFVMSHGRDIMILKIVGYAEKVTQYYLLDDFKAHGWIAHQRYPTKGRVWHPGGAHPFIGVNEALVHNGDFANYHSISEYLRQYNRFPQFLTDTEVSVQLFDLWNRDFGYPLEYIIEAMAPTTEHDFDRLPAKKQCVYRHIQSNHIHGSPDGPWFFIITRNDVSRRELQLIGITDTAMLRPQVFAIQEGEGVQIGLICSEKQAIDATLQNLAAEDSRFSPIADKYWNARGGSSTDGGAFIFTIGDSGHGDGSKKLTCTNKFGEPVTLPAVNLRSEVSTLARDIPATIANLESSSIEHLRQTSREGVSAWDLGTLRSFCNSLVNQSSRSDDAKAKAIECLTYLNDHPMPSGAGKRSIVLRAVREALTRVFESAISLGQPATGAYRKIDWRTRGALRAPVDGERVLVLNAREFPPEGDDCDARLIVGAHRLGWREFIAYGYRGQRFTGCGLIQNSDDVRIDVYDSSGDYLASGIDGLEIRVHGNAQDQVGQIMKRGKLVVYGDVGQTFMYGAKGGDVYVMGNAAGRPLINAVGRPRVVINGTCLDYLAESFMAGDPLNGGGFVIMNGIALDDSGNAISLDNPYPGSNLFSLASGGAIYIRDPHKSLADEQLNGGEYATLTQRDWDLILPYLRENERLFGIKVDDLLMVGGAQMEFHQVYRKVQPARSEVLAAATTAPRPSPSEYAGLVPEGELADE